MRLSIRYLLNPQNGLERLYSSRTKGVGEKKKEKRMKPRGMKAVVHKTPESSIISQRRLYQTNGFLWIWLEMMWQGLWRTVNRRSRRLPNISWCPRRCISTTCLDPSLRAFTSSLVQKQPVFELPPSSIQILKEPSQFYKTLLVSIIQHSIFFFW